MALITDLPAASGLSNNDLLVIDTGSQTQKITVDNFLKDTICGVTPLTFTPASGVTINSNASYQVGKLVVVNVRVTLSSTINANSTILSNVPSPLSTLGSGSAQVACSCNRINNTFTIVVGGQLVASDVNATAQMYVISATYFTA